MGNKLCAPWKKGYRENGQPWAPKKDSHLLRLWAEIFEVHEDEGQIYWARVSDDVVPVNITCIQDSPETVFQITAYNRHVEKVFDVRLIQPGTPVTQASECFAHWKDLRTDREWGMNFTTPVDARRFRDCCMAPMAQGCARMASSSGSLRLSPPKRVQGRKATSNPTSPVAQPRRALSTPDDLAFSDVCGEDHHTADSLSQHGLEAMATFPRARQRHIPHAQSIFEQNSPDHGSDTSACDDMINNSNMNRPIGEREIPFTEYQQSTFNTL